MNRLQNAQKQLDESLAALESAVEHAQNLTAFSSAGDVADAADSDRPDASVHPAPAIDMCQLSQDLPAIEADLETAINMIAKLTASGSSSGRGEDSL